MLCIVRHGAIGARVWQVSFGSKLMPGTFGCVAMGSALLFIVRSILLVYYAGSGLRCEQSASCFIWI